MKKIILIGCIIILCSINLLADKTQNQRKEVGTNENSENEVYKDYLVISDSANVIFHDKFGKIIYNKILNNWHIDDLKIYQPIIINNNEYFRNFKTTNQSFPREAIRATYITVQKRVHQDNAEMVLCRLAGEGAVTGSHCIIDLTSQKSYYFSFNKVVSFTFDEENLWLRASKGIMEIEKETGNRSDFIMLPFLDDNSKSLHTENEIFIAVDEFGIEQINLDSKDITFWDVSNIFGEYPQKMVYMKKDGIYQDVCLPRERIIFTNFEENDSCIFIGCYFAHSSGYLEKNSSYLLIYSKSEKKWKTRNLKDVNVVSIIKLEDNNLWMGAHQTERWEGAWRSDNGGIYLYDIEMKKSIRINKIDKYQMITQLIISDQTVKAESFYFSLFDDMVKPYIIKRIFEIDKSSLIVKSTALIDSFTYKNHEEYIAIKNEFTSSKQIGLEIIRSDILSSESKKIINNPNNKKNRYWPSLNKNY